MHCSEEDRDALNADMTQLTLEDFSSNCGICSLKFLTKNSVVYHQKIEHRVGVERTIECEKCKKVLKPANLKAHMKIHMEKALECQLCYKRFRIRQHLNEHQTNVHKNEAQYLDRDILDSELIYNCDECNKRFVSQNSLLAHRRHHDKNINAKSTAKKGTKESHACRLCYKTFSCRRDVVQHEKGVHVKEAKYLQREILDSELVHICTLCDKRFVTNNLLVSHRKKHAMEKYEPLRREAYDKNTQRFSCKFCYRTFGSFAELVPHIELAHKSDLERINEIIITADLSFSCNDCDLIFISNDILTYHKNMLKLI